MPCAKNLMCIAGPLRRLRAERRHVSQRALDGEQPGEHLDRLGGLLVGVCPARDLVQVVADARDLPRTLALRFGRRGGPSAGAAHGLPHQLRQRRAGGGGLGPPLGQLGAGNPRGDDGIAALALGGHGGAGGETPAPGGSEGGCKLPPRQPQCITLGRLATDQAVLPGATGPAGSVLWYGALAIGRIKHSGLRRLWRHGDDRQVPPDCVVRLGAILSTLANMQTSMRNPSHPGRVVRTLGFEEGTPAAMSAHIGVDLAELQPVLDGEAPMTPSLASALEDAGIGLAALWVRMQGSYDRAQERLRREREGGGDPAIPAAAPRQTEAASAS